MKEVGISFAKATKESVLNVVSTLGITSISSDESAEKATERNPLREELKKQYTLLGAYAFIVFVLLYIPCVTAIVALVQELGSWKWFGVIFAYQMTLAWGMAFMVYQGGVSWDWEDKMGVSDMIIAAVILAGAVYILYRSLWKKKGHCCGCDSGNCGKKCQP